MRATNTPLAGCTDCLHLFIANSRPRKVLTSEASRGELGTLFDCTQNVTLGQRFYLGLLVCLWLLFLSTLSFLLRFALFHQHSPPCGWSFYTSKIGSKAEGVSPGRVPGRSKQWLGRLDLLDYSAKCLCQVPASGFRSIGVRTVSTGGATVVAGPHVRRNGGGSRGARFGDWESTCPKRCGHPNGALAPRPRFRGPAQSRRVHFPPDLRLVEWASSRFLDFDCVWQPQGRVLSIGDSM